MRRANRFTMNGLTWCFVFAFIQTTLGRAQSDDQTPTVVQPSSQLGLESPPLTTGVQEFAVTVPTPVTSDLLTQPPPNDQTSVQSSVSNAVTLQVPISSQSSDDQTSIQSPILNVATFPTGTNAVSPQPTTNHQASVQSPGSPVVPSYSTGVTGYSPQQTASYPTSIQSPVPAAAPPFSNAMNGYSTQPSSYQTSLQSPFQADMSAYSSPNPNEYTGFVPPASPVPYYHRQLAYPPMPYGNMPYYPGYPGYYPMPYPMGMNGMMGYMNPAMPFMGSNPSYTPFAQPPSVNFNHTQFNGSLTSNAQQSTPYPQTAYAPAPEPSPDSTPTVVSSNGESGSDLNSLPPQVKEFIDMIPNILSMQDTPQPASHPIHPTHPIHSMRRPPLRKYPKTATSSLLKKKQYYNYPQYPDYPRRYGYYF